jgi:hypothetical protein
MMSPKTLPQSGTLSPEELAADVDPRVAADLARLFGTATTK